MCSTPLLASHIIYTRIVFFFFSRFNNHIRIRPSLIANSAYFIRIHSKIFKILYLLDNLIISNLGRLDELKKSKHITRARIVCTDGTADLCSEKAKIDFFWKEEMMIKNTIAFPVY